MTTAVSAYAATSATEPLTKTTITRRDVGPHDVAFDIHFAGICHSDIHTVQGEWGERRSTPWCPATRSPAIVTEVGSEVTKYQVGDRVGVGCFVDSCRECDNCQAGRGAVLQRLRAWSARTTAWAATASRPRAATAARSSSTRTTCCASPTRSPLDAAAPLLCAGITLYSPLRHWNAGPGTRVAVIGLGGLGHMGVKLAAAMGAEVTVLSQSLKKMEDGLRLGADRVLRHQRSRDLREAGRVVRPDPQHRVGEPGPERLPQPAEARRHAGRTRHAREPDGGPGTRTDRRCGAACPAR